MNNNQPFVIKSKTILFPFFGWILTIITGSMALFLSNLIPGDVLLSALVVSFTLFITGTIARLFPYLFNIGTLRIPGVYAITYTLMILIPLPLIYSNYPTTMRTTYLFATTTGFILSLMGIVFMGLIFSSSDREVKQWMVKPFQVNQIIKLLGLTLLILCFFLLVLYVYTVRTLPLIQVIQGGYSRIELAISRENALKLIQGRIVYFFTLLRHTLFPYTTLIFLTIAIKTQRRRWWLLFLFALMGSMLMATATLEKSPAVGNILMLAFVWFLAKGRSFSLKLKSALPLGVFAFTFPVFVYFAVYSFAISPKDVAFGIIRRLFYLPGEVLYHYFAYFPNVQEFLLGRSLPYISKLLPGGPFPVANNVCLFIYTDSLESCNANGAYIGFLWGDFGWFGVIIGSILVGVFLQGIQILILRLPKLGSSIVLQAMIAFHVIFLTSTSFIDIIDPLGRGFAIILTLITVALTQFGLSHKSISVNSRDKATIST